MASQFLRPMKGKWLLQGSWGRRELPAMTKVDLYSALHRELIESGILPQGSLGPSNKYHFEVTNAIMRSSWMAGRWIPDEPFAARLKRLRDEAGLTQEQLAAKSGLDVGTIRQLEQGTRTNPQWQTVCALARGLESDVGVFVGTEAWQPPETEEEKRRRELAERIDFIEEGVIMRLEALGHPFNRPQDKVRIAEMRKMSKPELERLGDELSRASTAQDAITLIVKAITASKAGRRAEEKRKLDAFGVKARIDMHL